MALTNVPLTFAQAVVGVAGTAVAPSNPQPSNCWAVVILNVAGAGDALVGIASPGVGTLTEGVNATRIPDGASLTLPLGTESVRGPMDESEVAGSGLVYTGVVGVTPTLDITYLNQLGSS